MIHQFRTELSQLPAHVLFFRWEMKMNLILSSDMERFDLLCPHIAPFSQTSTQTEGLCAYHPHPPLCVVLVGNPQCKTCGDSADLAHELFT